jgi:hypothetical protein
VPKDKKITRKMDGKKFLNIYELKWTLLKIHCILLCLNISIILKVSDASKSEGDANDKKVPKLFANQSFTFFIIIKKLRKTKN